MPSTMRTRRPSTATAGRFGRPAGGTTKRRTVVPQPSGIAGGWLQRRQAPKQSALKRAMSGVSGALPGMAKRQPAASRRGGRRSKVGGGLAVLAGAAGLAFKNRDRLSSRMRRDGGQETRP